MPPLTAKLPPLFVERFGRIHPGRLGEQLLALFACERPTTFRVNTLLAGVEDVRRSLQEDGWQLERVPWLPGAFIVRNRSLRELTDTPAYQAGHLYVQALSSVLPPLVLDPQPGEDVLDMTAAPGSKTTQMAAMMRNEGRLIANDNNKPRFFKLMANVERQGATCVECTMWHGETLWRHHGEVFDRVLVDAPCSAEGRFDARDPKSFGYWKPRKISEMMRKQKRLLFAAIRVLKVGGTLVYSTCTFAPEENEGVVSWALKRHPGVIELSPIPALVGNATAALTAWEGKPFDPPATGVVRILPTTLMEGFFLARFRKLAPVI